MNDPVKQLLMEELVRRSEEDFDFFLDALTIKSGRGPLELADTMAAFQRRCFNDLKPSLIAVRNGQEPPCKRFWIERTKKASKDTDIAASLLWLLAFPKRPLLIQIGAADKDQAAIARDRLNDLLYYNEWLKDLVQIKKYEGQSHNGLVQLQIEAADVHGSHGATPDVLVCNELSHVSKWEFVENMLDNADGVPNSVAIMATNAGWKDKPAWKLRQTIIGDKNWKTHIYGQPAPWHNKAFLEDAKRRSTKQRYDRLWHGVWASKTGDGFDSNKVDRLFKHKTELTKPEKEWVYVMGMDLGITHDHAALVVLGVCLTAQRIRLAKFQAYKPNPKTGEVDLTQVEDDALQFYRHFRCIHFGFDPYQAVLMSQRLKKKGVNVQGIAFTVKSKNAMAVALKDTVETGTLELYDVDGKVRTDIDKFSIVETAAGLTLQAESDAETGHADVGTGIVIALLKAVELLGSVAFSEIDSIDYSEGIDEKDETQMEQLPDEFRELFGVSQNLNKPKRLILSEMDGDNYV